MDHKKIIDSLRHCSVKGNSCRECPSYHQDSGCLDELHAEAAALLEAQQKRIAELEAKGKWIPVAEGLPKGECIALGYQNEMLIGYIGDSEYSDTGYAAESDGEHLSDVTHWMPLPEGPEEVHDG